MLTKGFSGPTELYDLATDIGETSNVAVSHPEIVRKMEEIMEQEHMPSDVFPFSFETSESPQIP